LPTYLKFNFFFLLLFGFKGAFSQNFNALKKEAEVLFQKQKYADAKPKYRQLLAVDQKNTDFNYKYGVCVYETENKLNARRYFDLILNRSTFPTKARFYRGKIFQFEYQFDKAILEFEACKNDKLLEKEASNEIKSCNSAKELIKLKSNLVVKGKYLTNKGNHEKFYQFSQPYSFYSPEKGEVYEKRNNAAEFKPKYLFKRGMKYRVFASYSEKKEFGLDIFIQCKNNSGDWGEIMRIPSINTSSDENYPYFDDSTGLLYFASMGHNSMGGYDIFKAPYDWKTNTIGLVENLGFPINTPSDDYLYVPDYVLNSAFFTSNRNGDLLNTEVFNVSITQFASHLIASQAQWIDEVENQQLPVKLYTRNTESGETFGPFVSDLSGKIPVYLPVQGIYEYILEFTVYGQEKQFKKMVDIPLITDKEIIEQSIRYFVENSFEQIEISTHVRNIEKFEDIEPFRLQEIAKLSINEKSMGLAAISQQIVGNDVFLKLNIKEVDKKKALEKLVDVLLEKEIDLENNERFRLQSIESIEKNDVRIGELILDTENLKKELSSDNQSVITELASKKNEIQKLLQQNLVLMSLIERQNEINEIRPNLDDITLLNYDLNEVIQTKPIEEAEKFIASKLFQIQKSLDIAVISPQQIKTDFQIENSKKIENIEKEINSYSFQVDSLEKQIEKFNKELNSLSKKNQEKRKIELTSLRKQLNSTSDLKSESEYQRKLLIAEKDAFIENEELIDYIRDESLKIKQIDLITAVKPNQRNKEAITQQLLDSKEKDLTFIVQSELIELKKDYDANKNRIDLIKNSEEMLYEKKRVEQEFLTQLRQLQNSGGEEVIELIQLTQNRITEAQLRLDSLNQEKVKIANNEKVTQATNTVSAEPKQNSDNTQAITQATSTAEKESAQNSTNGKTIPPAINTPKNEPVQNNSKGQKIAAATNTAAKESAQNSTNGKTIPPAINTPKNEPVQNNSKGQKITAATNMAAKESAQNSTNGKTIPPAISTANDVQNSNNSQKSALSTNTVTEEPTSKSTKDKPIAQSPSTVITEPSQKSTTNEIPDQETSKLENPKKNSEIQDIKTKRFIADQMELLSAIETSQIKSSEPINERQKYTLSATKMRSSEKISRSEELKSISSLQDQGIKENGNQRDALLSVQVSKLANEIEQEENAALRKVLVQEKSFLEEERSMGLPPEKERNKTRLNLRASQIEETDIPALSKSPDYRAYVEERITLSNSINNSDYLEKKLAETTHYFASARSLLGDEKKLLEDSIKKMYRQLNEIEANISSSSAKLEAYQNQTKYETMVLQNIQPNIVLPNIETEQGTAASFKFNKKEAITFDAPLPVENNKLSGLVFRVQVGAFRKPVPPHLFREFTPVNGEVIANGLTCYMAGYFNSSIAAMNARNDIRLLGYADAFIVAYCDGKRISYQQGRAYENNKQCIALSENELMIKLQAPREKRVVPESSTVTSKKNTLSTLDEYGVEIVGDLSYLYLTVQVGVFNRIINPNRLNGITDLIINKAENGQLKYSSGRFDNFNDAKKRKAEVNNKGISDAFIVAYYNGKRISSSEAQKMMSMNPEIVKASTNNTFSSEIATKAPTVQSNFDFNLLKPTISKTKYYYVGELKIDEIWKPADNNLPFNYNRSSELITSPLFEKPFSSPEVIISLKAFQLKEFNTSGLKVIFKLSKQNSGVLLNHMMRTSYTFEITNDELVVYPRDHWIKEQLVTLKKQIEE